jgi:hypothetical protein
MTMATKRDLMTRAVHELADTLLSIPPENWGAWLVYLVRILESPELGPSDNRTVPPREALSTAYRALEAALTNWAMTGKWE